MYVHIPFLSLTLAAATSSLLAQESAALLHAPMVVLGVDSPPFQMLGDFDGDGDLDAVGTRHHQSGNSGQVVVWRNDQGVFQQVFGAATPEGMYWTYGARRFALEVADLNGDGRDDFVIASRNRVERYIAQPGMQFVQQTWWLPNAPGGARALTKGDFDADGLVDIAVLVPNGIASRLYAFFGSGAWTSALLTPSFANVAPVRLLSAELNGQPGDDLLLFEHGSHAAHAYNVVGGQYVYQQQFTSTISPTSGPWLWTGGDVDQDGDDDLVVFRPGYGTVAQYQVFRRVNAAGFVPEPVALGGPAEYLADVDGDGDLDGVCCGGGGGGTNYQWPKLDFPSTFEVALNDGSGTFAKAFQFPGAGSESLAGVADLDGDGDLELVAGRCVFYGDGPWDEAPMPAAGGAFAWAFARPGDLHDVDRDGDPDYRDVRNDGDGAFVEAPAMPPPSANSYYSGYAIWCDVDGDGARDRVLRQAGQVAGMVWHRNNGGGHFEHAGLCAPAGVYLGSMTSLTLDNYYVADFDGDGDEDLAVHGTGELFWNQGGVFATNAEQLPASGNIDAVGDFDADGLPDIAMSVGLQEVVLLGTGQVGSAFTQAWSTSFSFAPPFEPSASLCCDANGDGRDDFARVMPDGKLWLFVNATPPAGPVAFTTHALTSAPIWLSSAGGTERPKVTAADFDGDGDLDFGIARLITQPNVYSLLLRTGSDPNVHTYEERLFAARDGYATDADGDGDLDLIGVHTTRNRTITRSDGGRRLQQHAGVSGENGATPVLGGTGPYRPGGVHTLRLTGVTGPTVAVLGISLGEAALVDSPLPGLTLYLDPGLLLVGAMPITEASHGRAAAMATMALPIFPGIEGWTFYLQAFVPDPAATSLFTQSNLLSLRVGS